MRRKLARTRDTLDFPSLPPVEGTELNHRTKVWTDSQERHFTVRTLSYLSARVIFAAFVIRMLTVFSVELAAFCLIPLAFLMLVLAFSRYVKGWPLGDRLIKGFSYIAILTAFAATSLIGNIWAAYFAFGGAVIIAACFSRVIAQQYAFYMTANERLRVRTVRRWQGFWKSFPRLSGPRFLPEISAHTWSFPLLALPYAVGFGALMLAERSTYDRVAGAVSILAFLVALPVVWIILGDLRIQPHTPFLHSLDVTSRALVVWFSYNRHQTPAAGVFRFPTKWTRIPYLRNLSVFASLGLLSIAILSAAFIPLQDVTREVTTRLGDIPASFMRPKPPHAIELLPQEREFRDQLPPGLQVSYQYEVWKKRLEEESQNRKKRWSVSGMQDQRVFTKLIIAMTFSFVAPFLIFVAVFWFVCGRLLTAYYDALEAPDGHQQSTNKTPWDNRVDRLISSRDELETKHLYIGRSVYGDYPVLLHRELLNAHAHILGDTGSRKTSIGIAPMLTQLVGHEDSSIVIIDLKGDMPLFQCARAEAEAAGIPFKWFTNITGRSSYVFNPFAQSHMRLLNSGQKTQGLLQAMGLEFGEAYGKGHYSAVIDEVLSNHIKTYRNIGSFRQLHKFLRDKNAYSHIGNPEDWRDARHLTNVVNKLASVYPLNVKQADIPERHQLFQNQIDMPSLMKKRQVVYFYLASVLEPTTVSPVAKLAMFALLTAAAMRTRKEPHRVYVFIDEFQRVISENMKLFFEQARTMGLHFILANQTGGQLESSGTDLTDTVDSCTAFKQSFKATDLKSMKKLEELSGEALYHSVDWKEAIDEGLREAEDDAFDISHLQTGLFDSPTVNVKETEGPRLERNTIIELSAKPMASFVRFTEGKGYTQFSGYYMPVLSEYHISEKTFEKRGKLPWPSDGPKDKPEETVIGQFDDDDGSPGESPILPGNPSGPLTPENLPADFKQHIDERLTGPEVPRPASPAKKGKRRK